MTNADETHSAPEAVPNGNGAIPDTTETAGANTVDAAAMIATLESEKAELREKVLRTLADMENLRKRTEKDIADARAYAVTRFARDILDVADNLRRGLESVPAEDKVSPTAALKNLLDGVELTERDLLKKLDTHGVRKLEPVGQKFDPNLHQAMFEVPDETKPSGTVVQVIQSGFTIGDRVLRPALVGVSKASAKPAAASDTGSTVDKMV